MRYFRVKVKTLLIIILVIIISGSSAYLFRDSIIYAIGEVYKIAGKDDISGVYYKKVIESFPEKKSAVKGANRQIQQILLDSDMNYFRDNVSIIGDSSGKSGANISYKSIEDINGEYDNLIEYHKRSDLLAEYTIGVAIMNWFAGDADKALSLLESINYINDKELEQIRKLNLSAMYMNFGNIDYGKKIIEDDIGKSDEFSFIRKDLTSYSFLMNEEYEKFMENIEDNKSRYLGFKNLDCPYMEPFKDIGDIIEAFERFIGERKEYTKTNNSIEGVVTLDGEALPYTIVYLKENKYQNEFSSYPYDIVGKRSSVMGITDKEGKYRIENIPNGLYGLCIAVDWQRISGKQVDIRKKFDIELNGNDIVNEDISFYEPINISARVKKLDNKIEFTWEANRGEIDYYKILLGEIRETENKSQTVNFTYWSEDIKGNSYIFDVVKERNKSFNRSMQWDDDGINPYYALEPLYHKGYYAYKIIAYDKDGGIVFDNLGLYQNEPYDNIYIDGEEWTKADKLLIDRDYEEAVREYEKAFEKDSNDLHSLKALAKLYYYNCKTNKDKTRYWEKAEEYLSVLDNKLEDNKAVKGHLAYVFRNNKKYEEALDIYRELSVKGDFYYYNGMADIYVYLNKYDEAAKYYKKFYENVNSDYALCDLMRIYILQNRIELLEALGREFNHDRYYAEYEKVISEYMSNFDKTEYEEFYNLINAEKIKEAEEFLENRDDELSRLYKGVLVLQKNIKYEEKEERYTQIYNSIENETIKEFMIYLGKGGLNTGFGD